MDIFIIIIPICLIIGMVEIVKKLNIYGINLKRWSPLIAILSGLFLGVIFSIFVTKNQAYEQVLINSVICGLTASGACSFGKQFKKG